MMLARNGEKTTGVEKMVFKLLVLLVFKTPKTSEGRIFGFYGFLDINFSYKFFAQTIRLLFLYYNFIYFISIYMNFHSL